MYEVNSYYQEGYKIVGKRETIFKKHNVLVLDIESEIKECKCPECGHICRTSNIGTYWRDVEDVPYNFQSIWLHIHAHKFECTNKKCHKKYFDEALPFARKSKVKTNNFIQFILTLSIFLSSTSTSLILSLLGSSVSADVVDSIINKIEVKDNVNIEEIGVDDVAIRKGKTYATAIYDLKDHHLMALLDGRDAEEFKEWLKKHPKIKTVARDRASAYAEAINEVLPDCIQIADRFHLFDNLVKYLKDIFYSEVPEKIFIKDDQIVDSKSIEKIPVRFDTKLNVQENKLNELDYDNSQPVDIFGNEIIFDNKRHNINSKQYKEHDKKRREKYEMVVELRKRLKECNNEDEKQIALEFGISKNLLRKYKNMTDEEVEKILVRKEYKKRKTVMDDYINIIYKMIIDNVPPEYIVAYLVKKGYTGALHNIKAYIIDIVRNNNLSYNYSKLVFVEYKYPEDVTIITRYELLKYLLTLDVKKNKNSIIEKNINIILEKYPIAKEVQAIFKDFHDVMFSANPDNLDTFIESYKEVIPSFCNGIKKDIAPVKNAISYEINSGFVEGNNNKFKLIKRIIYGKSSLCKLLKRSYISFLSTLDDFDISIIVEDVLNA